MLSHEPKNYALLAYDGALVLRGVAFRSSRAEPFGEAFLRRAIARLLAGDVAGVRDAYLATVRALRAARAADLRRLVAGAAHQDARRSTSRPARAAASWPTRRCSRAAGRRGRVGERVRVYRTRSGTARCVVDRTDDDAGACGTRDPRDYDVEHYVRVLRDTFAARLVRAFTPDDFAAVFADPDQPSLFTRSLAGVRPMLTPAADRYLTS